MCVRKVPRKYKDALSHMKVLQFACSAYSLVKEDNRIGPAVRKTGTFEFRFGIHDTKDVVGLAARLNELGSRARIPDRTQVPVGLRFVCL